MRFSVLLAALPISLAAQEFSPLTGPEIEAALNDTTLVYDDKIVQTFHSSGRTLYDNGQPSWGNWRVQGDQYCSEWPPSGGWDCYNMDGAGDVLRFISERGHVTAGEVQK